MLIGLGHLTDQSEVRLRQRYVDGDLVPVRSLEELLGNLAEGLCSVDLDLDL